MYVSVFMLKCIKRTTEMALAYWGIKCWYIIVCVCIAHMYMHIYRAVGVLLVLTLHVNLLENMVICTNIELV